MAERSLDFRVLRRNRKVAEFNIHADPENVKAMQDALGNWLDAQGWSKGLWGAFEAEVRFAGQGKVRARVRTS